MKAAAAAPRRSQRSAPDGPERIAPERVEFVLVEPAEGGNLGAAARALANCGFGCLTLVRPAVEDWRAASKMAVHAAELLQRARRCDSLEAAVADTAWVVGTSARARARDELYPVIEIDEFLEQVRSLPADERLAVVFGSERTGLTNPQLGLCHAVLRLPTDPGYASLNLAQAVLLVAWELRRGAERRPPRRPSRRGRPLAKSAELDGLLEHARRTLLAIGYLNPQSPGLALSDLRRLLARARPERRELQLLRGIFHRMDVRLAEQGAAPVPNQPRGPGRRRER